MIDRFTDLPRRSLTVDFAKGEGALDFRKHSFGLGGLMSAPAPRKIVKRVSKLKPRMIRIFLQEYFYLYPNHGVFDWSKLDAYMEAVHNMGGDIMASICIKPKVLYPEVDETVWMPNNVEEWQSVIRTLVLRYSKEKQYVTHWAIANEQDQGEPGGCPYHIKTAEDYFEYYKITSAPIIEVLPEINVGGPSVTSWWERPMKYTERFVELCKLNNVRVDFTCYNTYHDNPSEHAAGARTMRDAIDKHNPNVKLYMTEFNIGIDDGLSLEEKPYQPKCAAALSASILALYDDNALDGSFHYHMYDQWCDPREFAPWYSRPRYIAEYWNDKVNRVGLFDLDGKMRPQYFVYKLLYSLEGTRVNLTGDDDILRGIASRTTDETLAVYITNHSELSNWDVKDTPEIVTQIQFQNAPEGVYKLNAYVLDEKLGEQMKDTSISTLTPRESRTAYVHPDFHFDIYTPADSVILLQLELLEKI